MKSLQSLLKTELKINTKLPLIVSVSGGIDSMALLSMLQETHFSLVVVHFNHLKREASIIEKDLVESYCKTHELPFHYYTIKVSEGNFHHQAHHLRAHYLREVADLYKTPYILTAHHLDDLLENVLIKLTRGSNLLGYAGMQMMHSDETYTYIKPLLYFSKHEISEYVHKHNVPYLSDDSNEDNYYLRNRYRHAVVPLMKQENPDLLEQIKKYHHQITGAFRLIRNITKSYLKETLTIPLDLFVSSDEALQDDMIAYLIEYYKLNVSYEIITKIRRMLLSKKPNQSYKLSRDYAFIKAYNSAKVELMTKPKMTKIKIKEGKQQILNVAIFTFLSKTDLNTAQYIKLCYNKLAFPLWLRHREEGDLLTYDYGHKKLKKLLIDKKIPMDTRNRLWVLTDNNNQVLWVENLYTNQTLGDTHTCYFKLEEVNQHA
jgi:bifunctional protein TilS/HprT